MYEIKNIDIKKIDRVSIDLTSARDLKEGNDILTFKTDFLLFNK